jgi:hypothetical protein
MAQFRSYSQFVWAGTCAKICAKRSENGCTIVYPRKRRPAREITMSRKLLSFGYDGCHRWAVLRLAGFTVNQCDSIPELRERLMGSEAVDAVIMVEDIVSVPPEAIIAAQSYFTGPLVLFEGRYPANHRDAFDLCVPILTRPEVWLPQIDKLTETSPSQLAGKHSRTPSPLVGPKMDTSPGSI